MTRKVWPYLWPWLAVMGFMVALGLVGGWIGP